MENLIELVIDQDDESGVDYIALVDHPAIESNWQAFNKQEKAKSNFAVEDEEKRIISGALMVADLPIYRNDERNGEHYVVFRKNTIKDIVFKFFRNEFTSNTNLMHNSNQLADGVFLFESFLIDKERGIETPKGFDKLTDGSWFGSMRVENDEIWQQVKDGTFKGFSVEGIFAQTKEKSIEEKQIERIIDIIKNA